MAKYTKAQKDEIAGLLHRLYARYNNMSIKGNVPQKTLYEVSLRNTAKAVSVLDIASELAYLFQDDKFMSKVIDKSKTT